MLHQLGRTLFDEADEALFVFDPADERLIDANPAAERLIGLPRAMFRGRGFRELFDAPGGLPTLEEALRDPTAGALREGHLRGAGAVRWDVRELPADRHPLALVRARMRPSGPPPAGVTDLERRASEYLSNRVRNALRESENRLRLAVEAAQIGIWDYLPRSGALCWSDRCRSVFGVGADEVIDFEHIFERMHPDDPDRIRAAIVAAIDPAGDGDYDVEYRYQRPDGEWRWIASEGRATFDGTGPARQLVRFTGTAIDVTERKRAEQELRERERFIDSINRAIPELLYVYDVLERRNVYSNGQITTLLGYSPEELQALGDELLPKLIHPDDLERVVEGHRRFQDARDGEVREGEYRIRNVRGEWRWLRSRETVFRRLPDGRVQQVVGAAQDVTERKAAEQALQDYSRQLRDLSRRLIEVQEQERRHLARELHDEIGQMLTGLNMALQTGPAAPGAGNAEPLDDARRVIGDITAQVRDLSLRLRPTMLDDLGLLPALLWHFERYTAQTKVAVDFKHRGIARRFPPEVETAAYRIVQEALTNVARHAGGVGGVAVRVGSGRGGLNVRVTDRGAGFDPERLGAPSSGLSGMRERAELLGGTFAAESRPGRGTRLTAWLPVAPKTARR